MTNYHTHTTFCDGRDTPAVMARAACDAGLAALGFSAHARHPISAAPSLPDTDDWHIALADYAPYMEEIHRLKGQYNGRMEVLAGFEADYIPGEASPADPFYREVGADYLIGSVHYIVHKKSGEPSGSAIIDRSDYFTVDGPVEEVRDGVERLFHGDARAAVCEYFALQREMLGSGGFEIWGHPDLFRKRNGVLHLFDESASWYIDQLEQTAQAAAHSGVIAEINTGGMARGAIDDVYPSAVFLRLLHDAGVRVVISSDAHRAADIAFGFDRALQAAKAAGYTEIARLGR